MRHSGIILWAVTGLLFFGAERACPAPLPYSIGGTVTVDGVLLTQSSGHSLTIEVTRQDGTSLSDINGDVPVDNDGLDGSNRYMVDIPIYSASEQPGGVLAGDSARVDVILDSSVLQVISPANGLFSVGNSGASGSVNLSANSCSQSARTGAGSYPSLQASYDSAVNGGVIEGAAVVYGEDLIADRDIGVILSGGYDCDFSRIVGQGTTTLNSLEIGSGPVVVDRVTIRNLSKTGGNPPAAPTGLTCAFEGPTTISLVWHDNSDNETGFHVYMDTTSAMPAGAAAATGANATSYSSTGLTPGTVYYFWVDAYNASGASAPTSCSVTTPADANTGCGSCDGSSWDNPKILPVNQTQYNVRVGPNSKMFYKASVPMANRNLEAHFSTNNTQQEMHMMLSEDPTSGILTTYEAVRALYQISGAWGGPYYTTSYPRVWANFLTSGAGENIIVSQRSSFIATVPDYYLMFANESGATVTLTGFALQSSP